MTRIVVAVALIAVGPALAADSSCQPTRDGRPRIEKLEGRLCPSEYFPVNGGRCCEAFSAESPHAVLRIEGRPCPGGTLPNGSYCLNFR